MDSSNKLINQLKIIYGEDLLSKLSEDQLQLLPVTKIDVATAKKILILPHEEVEKIIPFLLVWLKDINWPVAKVLSPYLAIKGSLVKNDIIKIFKGNDVMWKYWILVELVDVQDLKLAKLIKDELLLLTSDNNDASLQEEAKRIIQKIE